MSNPFAQERFRAVDEARRRGRAAAARAYPGNYPATEEEVQQEAIRLVREARLAQNPSQHVIKTAVDTSE